ncbi:branched-chain amino acid aminotransferase [Stackebrandtia nassauensis]|uniref:Branched-chain-amino-acid aminotransferase n=1 Tax=Stackebrandtia nassauensis (strain DSM 44728 / CIP 108903 / NRRL B-16338 / NBRC 102104 / LLR-40K-21) TaxID=446470 RepID=D3Q2K4_STANL|nr:branched-chain amino acid aminotransferase [Stackebrandtia nassauensis]ADD43937.1 branched-chain amino acid aminotransferase [Stackebrandtia nassauensis DSM 44728]
MIGGDLPQFDIRPNPRPRSAAERAEILANPGFGLHFTDHMVTIQYTEGQGWHDPTVQAYGPIQMSPATAVLHYAQEIFEGMKAYHRADGKIGLFRADENARRFQRSAERMAMAQLPEEWFLASLQALIDVDKSWVPDDEDSSLYLRPFMFANEAFLGVRPAKEFLYCVIASPAGAYFKSGPKPVSLWVSQEYTRAAPGGTGAAKCGGNYATSLRPQSEAIENGCEQVVFLDAVHRKYIDELGGMNIFFVYEAEKKIVTPELGTILAGVTRDAVLTLGRDLGYRVEERQYSFEEWKADALSGSLSETFACGTAAVLTPVGTVRDHTGEFHASGGKAGELTMKLRQTLLDIQHGKAADPYGWTSVIG